MRAIPELVPISQLRQRQSEVLARLSEGPVILTQHGQGAAVLVDLEVGGTPIGFELATIEHCMTWPIIAG
jgi:prevent-host-death family protein